jgi:hypothetical protein
MTALSLLQLDLARGGTAAVIAFDGEFVSVDSSRAMPPGSTLEGTAADGEHYSVKVRGCRRNEAGTYRIEGRFVNLSRAQRERLLGKPT